MRNTLLRAFAVRVTGMNLCLLVTLMFASVSVAQTQVTNTAIQPSARADQEAAAPGDSVVKKVGDKIETRGVTDGGEAAIELVESTEKKDQDQDPSTKAPDPSRGFFKRWALSLHAGASIPHGNFNTVFNSGPNVAIDLEYRISTTFSLEGIYGFHHFNGGTLGPFTLSDVNLHQLSLNGKVYGNGSPVRPFFNFGGGVYVFDSGGTTRGGLNVGGGVQFDISSTIAIEGVYNFHNVFTSGSNTTFSTTQGGVRFRF